MSQPKQFDSVSHLSFTSSIPPSYSHENIQACPNEHYPNFRASQSVIQRFQATSNSLIVVFGSWFVMKCSVRQPTTSLEPWFLLTYHRERERERGGGEKRKRREKAMWTNRGSSFFFLTALSDLAELVVLTLTLIFLLFLSLSSFIESDFAYFLIFFFFFLSFPKVQLQTDTHTGYIDMVFVSGETFFHYLSRFPFRNWLPSFLCRRAIKKI